MEKIIQRTERTAASDPERQRVLQFLRDQGRTLLVAAAVQRGVPAAAVSRSLVENFGAETFATPAMRRFCGLACAAILAEEGFVPDRTNVRIQNDPLFTYGSTYRPVGAAPESTSLVARLVGVLDEAELRNAERLIQARLRALRPARSMKSQR